MKKYISFILCIYILLINSICFADAIGFERYEYIINNQINPWIILGLFILIVIIIIISIIQLKRFKDTNIENIDEESYK